MKRLLIYTLPFLLLAGCSGEREEDLLDLEKMAVAEEEGGSLVLPFEDVPFIVDSVEEQLQLEAPVEVVR